MELAVMILTAAALILAVRPFNRMIEEWNQRDSL